MARTSPFPIIVFLSGLPAGCIDGACPPTTSVTIDRVVTGEQLADAGITDAGTVDFGTCTSVCRKLANADAEADATGKFAKDFLSCELTVDPSDSGDTAASGSGHILCTAEVGVGCGG